MNPFLRGYYLCIYNGANFLKHIYSQKGQYQKPHWQFPRKEIIVYLHVYRNNNKGKHPFLRLLICSQICLVCGGAAKLFKNMNFVNIIS